LLFLREEDAMSLDRVASDLFSSPLGGIIINLLSSLVLITAAFIVARWRELFSRSRPIRSVWRLNADSDDLYLVVADLSPKGASAPAASGSDLGDVGRFEEAANQHSDNARKLLPYTGLGELRGVISISQSLPIGYPNKARNVMLVFSRDFVARSETGDTISLGGPKYNELTAQMKDRERLCFDFNLSDPSFPLVEERHDNAQTTTHQPIRAGSARASGLRRGVKELDYGIITRLPNPADPRNGVLLLEGAGTYGVEGCAKVLTLAHIRDFAKYSRILKHGHWQALIEVEVRAASITPRLVKVIPIVAK
jgi:hypothetical protein